MKIGLFEAGLPNCEHDAGSTATVELCILAQEAGYKLEYIYTGENPWGRTDDLENNNIPYSQISIVDSEQKIKFLKQKKFDVALISRPGPAIEWLYACEAKGLPIIYFGHDIHYIRQTRGNSFLTEDKQIKPRDIKLMQITEQNIWKRAASVIYPSAQEASIVNVFCKKNHALEMPIYDLLSASENFKNHKFVPAKTEVNSLLFVGGQHHTPNYDAIVWFSKEVLPYLEIEFTLNIVGDWSDSGKKDILKNWNLSAKNNQKIEFLGRLGQAELYNIYKQADLVIAPLRYGAGIKRKVVESFAFAKPLLGTEISFEGIELPDEIAKNFLSEVNGKSYADKITKLLNVDLASTQGEIVDFSENIIAKYSDNYRKKILEKALSFI
ncbi:MAG TPA: hypothetical protein DIV86_03685 [Alphaproteobacteria bacterium]|nr:hypothetical protein [Alphaproteobacteria bacterium]